MVLFTMTEEKPSKLLTLVTTFVSQKYKKNIFFYGVIICDKHSFIVSIKVDIIYNDQRKTIRTINTCDGFCALKIQNIHFFMVLLFVTKILPS